MQHSPSNDRRHSPKSRSKKYSDNDVVVPQNFIPGYTTPELVRSITKSRSKSFNKDALNGIDGKYINTTKMISETKNEATTDDHNIHPLLKQKHSKIGSIWPLSLKHKKDKTETLVRENAIDLSNCPSPNDFRRESIVETIDYTHPTVLRKNTLDTIEYSVNNLLPDKILRKEYGIKKWKSLETMHNYKL